jgi:hypothetical protein
VHAAAVWTPPEEMHDLATTHAANMHEMLARWDQLQVRFCNLPTTTEACSFAF